MNSTIVSRSIAAIPACRQAGRPEGDLRVHVSYLADERSTNMSDKICYVNFALSRIFLPSSPDNLHVALDSQDIPYHDEDTENSLDGHGL